MQAGIARKGVLFVFLLLPTPPGTQAAIHACLLEPSRVDVPFSPPSPLLQGLLTTPAYPSFLLPSGVGEVA